jgi:hypothetical protein
MVMTRLTFCVLASLALLSGCAHNDNDSPATATMIVPSPDPNGENPEIMPEAPPGAAMGTPDMAMGQTGTAVGQKVLELRADLASLNSAVQSQAANLQSLRAGTQANAADYFNTVAAISAKLQVGTTTGNPILVAQWHDAQNKLNVLNQNVGQLNALSNQIASSASQAAYLLEAVRATFGISGAVDEDHANLSVLEDDTNRTVVMIDRMLNEVTGDLNRQTTYVASERRNLETLSLAINNGELYGQSFANKTYSNVNVLASEGRPGRDGDGHDGHRPLVVIRFDRDNVEYQHAVYQAVSDVLQRYPEANFDLVAVNPAEGNAAEVALNSEKAKRHADGVARTLSQMGLPANRIHMSATSSANATVNEVQLFVR